MLEFFKHILKRKDSKINALLKIYREIDNQVSAFSKATGLKCLEGCGQCCVNAYVETTALEMLPIAHELSQRGEVSQWLKVPVRSDAMQCVFYKPDPLVPGHGRCSIYALRPSVCRLFGFSARTDKNENPQLVTCANIKRVYAQNYIQAQKSIEKGLPVAKMQDFSTRISHIDLVLGKEKLPINDALIIALEKVGLNQQLDEKFKNNGRRDPVDH